MVKRNVIFLSVLVLITILIGIGVSYSLWNISVSQDTTNMAETKCFDLSITNQENNISLENAYPISNDKGKSLTPYTFTVTNTCDITAEYSVNLEVLNNSTLSSKFIDVMLENNDIKEINLLSNFDNTDKVNTSSIESRKLTTGILKSGKSKSYSLRLWIDYNTTLEDLNNEIKSFKSKIIIVGKPINFNYDGDMVFNFDYTGGEQTFIAPVSGTYKLETWGAQGSNGRIREVETNGGYGGYSFGQISISKNDNIYIQIGGNSGNYKGGYNGGGSGNYDNIYNQNFQVAGGGGGATHIASKSGLLSELENYKNNIIIVSGGGGGGANANLSNGGSAGGYVGNNGTAEDKNTVYIGIGGNQNSGGNSSWSLGYGKFGIGGFARDLSVTNYERFYASGGGAGFYGGSAGNWTTNISMTGSGGGGSGYIGNSLLTNKVMYCYNCEESNEESTKTISTTCSEETPTSYCAKKGNGYARISLVSIDE